ncbi:MAG: ankyrin repeat domain-containing protein [Chthonomonadales bacterium]
MLNWSSRRDHGESDEIMGKELDTLHNKYLNIRPFINGLIVVVSLLQLSIAICQTRQSLNEKLMLACGANDKNLKPEKLVEVTQLLKQGANPNARSKDGWTPLLNAVSWGHINVAKLLINHGAQISTADSDGISPLMMVASRPYDDGAFAKFLFDHGARIGQRDTSGRTALDWKRKNGNEAVAREIEQELNKREANVSAPKVELTSPPIVELGGKRIRIVLPSSWTHVQHDPTDNWYAHFYEFSALIMDGGHGTHVDVNVDRSSIYRLGGIKYRDELLQSSPSGIRIRARRHEGDWEYEKMLTKTLVLTVSVSTGKPSDRAISKQVRALFDNIHIELVGPLALPTREIVSNPLDVLGGKSIKFKIPNNWDLIYKSSKDPWSEDGFDCTLHRKGSRSDAVNLLTIEFSVWSRYRSEVDKYLKGKGFETQSGMKGFLTTQNEENKTRTDLALPIVTPLTGNLTRESVIIATVNERFNAYRVDKASLDILRSVQIVEKE